MGITLFHITEKLLRMTSSPTALSSGWSCKTSVPAEGTAFRSAEGPFQTIRWLLPQLYYSTESQ